MTLVFSEVYDRLTDAIARERQIKGWTRKKKEALIRGDYEALPDLASRPLRPHPEVRRPQARASKGRKTEG